jgi:inosine-uridine nucleoside N-ribohydrolase
MLVALVFSFGITPAGAARSSTSKTPIFVDTDIGIDDAVAITWLLKQRSAKIVGFSTVHGNTTVDNATRNLLTLLDAFGLEKPISIGAAEPLEFPRFRTGALVHGPDGFWFAQRPHDISALPTDAPAAIADAARNNPNLTIVALGPLTNIAQAVEEYPSDLAGVRLVALGGGKRGNISPVAEFNIYSDPQALDIVLASQMRVELVTVEAFEQVEVDSNRFLAKISARNDALSQIFAQILPPYFGALSQGAGDNAAIADVAAAVYALRSDMGTPTPALVRVVTENGYTRGQTLIGDTFNHRIALIANAEEISLIADQAFIPGFDLNAMLFGILVRQPDNAQVILDVKGKQMARLVENMFAR